MLNTEKQTIVFATHNENKVKEIHDIMKDIPIYDKIDIMGFTCLEQDSLYKDFPESLQTGDVLELRNVGGYSIVYKPPFIQPQCPVVCVTKDNEIIEIKRKETFDDIFQTFKF